VKEKFSLAFSRSLVAAQLKGDGMIKVEQEMLEKLFLLKKEKI
jgi:hypothetical protein